MNAKGQKQSKQKRANKLRRPEAMTLCLQRSSRKRRRGCKRRGAMMRMKGKGMTGIPMTTLCRDVGLWQRQVVFVARQLPVCRRSFCRQDWVGFGSSFPSSQTSTVTHSKFKHAVNPCKARILSGNIEYIEIVKRPNARALNESTPARDVEPRILCQKTSTFFRPTNKPTLCPSHVVQLSSQ